MPLISLPDDGTALRLDPSRVVVAGTSGAGKSTLAGVIARELGLPHTETDALHWGWDWTPRESFLEDVRAVAAGERWVAEWQYTKARPILLERATVMLWLDLPVPTVMRQVVRRTLARRLRRERIWGTSVEPPLRTFFTDRDHIVRWAWRTRHKTAQLVAAALEQRPELPVLRVRSHAEARDAVRLLAEAL